MNRENLTKSLQASDAFYAKALRPAPSPQEIHRHEQKHLLQKAYEELAEFEQRLRALELSMGHIHDPHAFSWKDSGSGISADDGSSGDSDGSGLGADGGDGGGYDPDEARVPAGSPDGGEWTSGGGDSTSLLPSSGLVMDDSGHISQTPTYSDAVVPDSWANPNLSSFEDHFERHGAQFSANSPEDYAVQANEFYNIAQEEKFPMLETSDGYLKIYDPQTNSFGVYNPEGQTQTFYKPSSPTYFERQISDVANNGGRIIEPLPMENEPIVPEGLIP